MNTPQVNLSKYQNKLGLNNKMQRLAWRAGCLLFFRPLMPNFLMPWRRLVLRLFGARLGKGSVVHSSVRIWAPWNLEMGDYSCLAGDVDCYNVDKVVIGANTTVSQKSYICTASHDITDPRHPLITAPVHIGDQAWIAADAFIGMGVRVGQGAVVGARAAVFRDVDAWTIVGGNPAKPIKKRIINPS